MSDLNWNEMVFTEINETPTSHIGKLRYYEKFIDAHSKNIEVNADIYANKNTIADLLLGLHSDSFNKFNKTLVKILKFLKVKSHIIHKIIYFFGGYPPVMSFTQYIFFQKINASQSVPKGQIYLIKNDQEHKIPYEEMQNAFDKLF